MWYLIVGRVLTILTYSVYLNYVYELKKINTVEIFLGWFLLEHIFEEYCMTPSKLFLTYEDFRMLIVNIFLLARNIFFMAQFFTPAEFIFINVVLIIVILKYKKKLKSNVIKVFITLIYVFIFNSFLAVNVNLICELLNYVWISYLATIVFVMYLSVLYQGISFCLLDNQTINSYFNFFFIKLVVYVLLIFLTFLGMFIVLNLYVNLNENFVQEFVLNNLILYLYVYYL